MTSLLNRGIRASNSIKLNKLFIVKPQKISGLKLQKYPCGVTATFVCINGYSLQLFEDIHWLVLLIGYTISDSWSEGQASIPSQVTDFLGQSQDTINVEFVQHFIRT